MNISRLFRRHWSPKYGADMIMNPPPADAEIPKALLDGPRNDRPIENYENSWAMRDGCLWYPRGAKEDGQRDWIIVELIDVRSADNLVIKYDFDRDGYIISREDNPDKELAFIRSWEEYDD